MSWYGTHPKISLAEARSRLPGRACRWCVYRGACFPDTIRYYGHSNVRVGPRETLSWVCSACGTTPQRERPPGLTRQELLDALDGFHAYDTGCVDSGVHDPILKERVKAQILAKGFVRGMRFIHQAAQELYGQAPYTQEDVDDFLAWWSREVLGR